MTYAVLSDIHGNTLALKAALDDIRRRGIKHIINLGDSLYGPLDPAGTFQLIKKNNMISVSGNEDRELIDGSHNPTIQYTLSQISDDATAWLKSLPFETVVDDTFYCCHGIPRNDHEYFVESVKNNQVVLRDHHEIEAIASCAKQNLILCGHSHVQRFIKAGEKLIINPGSVGCPAYDDDNPSFHRMESGTPHAKYAVVHVSHEDIKVEHVSLPYDHETMARLAEKNNRHDWAKWLRTGRA